MLVERLLAVARERLISVRDDAPLLEVAGLLSRGHVNIVLACGADDAVSGVVTKTDIVRQMSVCSGGGCVVPVSMVMSRDVIACSPQDWLADAWAVMKRTSLLQLPILGERSEALGVLYARCPAGAAGGSSGRGTAVEGLCDVSRLSLEMEDRQIARRLSWSRGL